MYGQKLMELKKIKKYYHQPASLLEKIVWPGQKRAVYAVDDVSFSIYKGEVLGLVGESGCGKSTLGRTVVRLHDVSGGRVFYDGEDITDIKGAALKEYRKKSQIIFQNPYSSLNPRKTVRHILEIALRQRGIRDVREQEKEILALLERVGFARRYLDQYPHQFSGGQRQRIGIARALAMKPEFIVADEPVSALDVSVQAQIINLLEELREDLHLTYLFIAHDLSVVNYVSSRVAVMYLGRLVELAETEELFSNPKHPYTRALLSSVPDIDKERRRERIILGGSIPTPMEKTEGCPFQNRCYMHQGERCERVRPEWIEREGHGVACHLYADGHTGHVR